MLPFAAILLVVLQTTLADIIFSGLLTLELTIIVVIYAGFHLDLPKGMFLAFVTGFVLDCLSGTVLGLFTIIYLVIFLISFFVSLRIDSGKLYLIAGFSLICSLLESLILISFYHFVFEHDMVSKIPLLFLPQALIISVFAVCFFLAMRRIEGLFIYG